VRLREVCWTLAAPTMGLRTAFKAWTLRMPPPPPSLPENMTPSEDYLIKLLLSLSIVILTCTVIFKSSNSRALLEALGVSLRRVKRTLQEIDRKGFHLAGILVPIVHHSLLRLNYSNALCIEICAAITIVGWCCDLARLCIPAVARNWPGRSILREKERQQLTGGCYFSLGCTLSIAISPPSIAMASILFLVLGDMSAAIIGVSFGGETVSLKLGREGKKITRGIVRYVLHLLHNRQHHLRRGTSRRVSRLLRCARRDHHRAIRALPHQRQPVDPGPLVSRDAVRVHTHPPVLRPPRHARDGA